LELPCVLLHPSLSRDLQQTARLLRVSKAVAAAATAARGSNLQGLCATITCSRQAKKIAAWTTKYSCLLQGMHTLQLKLDRAAIDGYSWTAGSSAWDFLSSALGGCAHSTTTAAAAAAILQSMPRTLSNVVLELQDNEGKTAVPLQEADMVLLRSVLAALPRLKSISIAGPGAAACLPIGFSQQTVHLSQLTSLRLSTISSPAAVAQLLASLPASLRQLRIDVDTPNHQDLAAALLAATSDKDWQQLLAAASDKNWQQLLAAASDKDWQQLLQHQQQCTLSLTHLTALTALHLTGQPFLLGREFNLKLPNSIINLTVPVVPTPLLHLARLQRLSIRNMDRMPTSVYALMARCLTQLTHLGVGYPQHKQLRVDHDDVCERIEALSALQLQSVCVLAYGPHIVDAGAFDTGLAMPALVGLQLRQLTTLRRLTIVAGCYDWQDLAGGLTRLTRLQELALPVSDTQGDSCEAAAALYGGVRHCERFVDAIAGLQQLRCLTAGAMWFGGGYQHGSRPHPIMRLQAACKHTGLCSAASWRASWCLRADSGATMIKLTWRARTWC
jgi:hypothetical protein